MNFVFSNATIDAARQVIAAKAQEWEGKTRLKFDNDGRTLVGKLPGYDLAIWQKYLGNYIDEGFADAFLKGLTEMELKEFPIFNMNFYNYLSRRVDVESSRNGRVMNKAVASLLTKGQEVWERENPLYRLSRQYMKETRADIDNADSVAVHNYFKKVVEKMERGNVYVAYDKLLKEFREVELYLTINPLDKIFASGGVGDITPTRISSCWSNEIYLDQRSGEYVARDFNSFANPKAQYMLGSHMYSGMIFLKNGNSISAHGMEFFGFAQRSHVWLNNKELFIENMYPDKYNEERLRAVCGVLSEKVKIHNIESWHPLDIEPLNKGVWYRSFIGAVNEGKALYLDRSAIDTDGSVWITPIFRYHNHGGNFNLPEGVRAAHRAAHAV